MAIDTNDDTLQQTWAAGGTALGGWLSLGSSFAAETTARLGFEYVCIDMQHGLAELRDVEHGLRAISGRGPTPIVRVPWNEPGIIGRALDLGALGVIIPMVNSPEEAAAAVAACRYAPQGHRSVGPIVPAQRYGSDYFAGANSRVACIPMIETDVAVSRIDEILAVPGIDAVYIGPADLSATLGLPPSTDQTDPRFDDALATVVDSCRRHGVVPGIHATAALAGKRHRQGFRMITVSMDTVAMVTGIRTDHATARAALGDRSLDPAGPAGPSSPYGP